MDDDDTDEDDDYDISDDGLLQKVAANTPSHRLKQVQRLTSQLAPKVFLLLQQNQVELKDYQALLRGCHALGITDWELLVSFMEASRPHANRLAPPDFAAMLTWLNAAKDDLEQFVSQHGG